MTQEMYQTSGELQESVSFFRSIQGKLLIWFLLFSLVPLSALGVMVYQEAQDALKTAAFSQMAEAITLKKARISRVVQRWKADLDEMSRTPGVIYAMGDLANGFRFLGAEKVKELYGGKPDLMDAQDGSAYSAVHQEQHAFLPGHKKILGFVDILLVDKSGNVIYSTLKNKVFGSNLLTGGYKDNSLGTLFQQLQKAKKEGIYFVDVGLMDGEPVMFAGTPVFNGEYRVGALIYEVPFQLINSIMEAGLGKKESEETYMVGGDKRMRTDSHLRPDTHSVKASLSGTVEKNGVDTVASRKALAGKTGTDIIQDYRGVSVLSSYAPFDMGGINWAIIAGMDETKAFSLSRHLRNMTWVMGGDSGFDRRSLRALDRCHHGPAGKAHDGNGPCGAKRQTGRSGGGEYKG